PPPLAPARTACPSRDTSRGGGEALLRPLAVARPSVPLAEAEVAVGHEGAHAEFAGDRQGRGIVVFGVLGAGRQRDVTGEAEGVRLGPSSPYPAGERQGLAGVAGGLVDPPGREAGRPRAQKDETGSDVILTTAECRDGTRDHQGRLISTA